MRYHLSIFIKCIECIELILCWYAHLKNCCEIKVATEIMMWQIHDDVIKWKHFPRYWPFVRWIHRWPMNSPHKGQWGGALVFSLICVWINGWINNRVAGDLRRYLAHYDVIIMILTELLERSAKNMAITGKQRSLIQTFMAVLATLITTGTVGTFVCQEQREYYRLRLFHLRLFL